ncbi:hypothetical protein FKO59_35730 [Burkholderia pseudomallei]|uniref:Uncharacterized protein n=1 Tax=Burkholderia pseudomallei (strain 1106a) TaxID=357348 RepID=A3P393_BURP0|nr:hypothetical protein BURPS1106A_A0767 [Burkholderia pseudomallei 1106a]NRE31335.1 hypothetical protein [Burkholderia pseudomallei]QCU31180.1 hypothetical protein FE789_24880 [Burkholderia pseudomallei]QDH32434.1 hypothetical protein FKO42_35770 [Burkholderia pseudomallei]QDH42680.1 hypothetical protein FKO59_35730 [Burkholderia pseudomallei]
MHASSSPSMARRRAALANPSQARTGSGAVRWSVGDSSRSRPANRYSDQCNGSDAARRRQEAG